MMLEKKGEGEMEVMWVFKTSELTFDDATLSPPQLVPLTVDHCRPNIQIHKSMGSILIKITTLVCSL